MALASNASRGRVLIRAAIATSAVIFVLLNVWAFQSTPMRDVADFVQAPIGALSEFVPGERWVTVVVADLVIGWFLTAIVIWRVERRHWAAILWIVGVFAIGNLVTAVFFLLRIDRIGCTAERGSNQQPDR